jgi:hypothetical protein
MFVSESQNRSFVQGEHESLSQFLMNANVSRLGVDGFDQEYQQCVSANAIAAVVRSRAAEEIILNGTPCSNYMHQVWTMVLDSAETVVRGN